MDCSICLNTVCENNKTVLVCNHIFCETCILNNLQHLKKCPLCREILVVKPRPLTFIKFAINLHRKINDALFLVIKMVLLFVHFVSLLVWIILINYIAVSFPSFAMFVLGYVVFCILISSALVYLDKIFKLNSFEPTYLSIM